MAKYDNSRDTLELFLKTGIYRLDDTNAVFMDPVRVLNRCYTHHKLKPSAYYSRSFFKSKSKSKSKKEEEKEEEEEIESPPVQSISKKRRRNTREKKSHVLNDKEQVADRRHQDVRPLLLMAHEALVRATDLLTTVRNLNSDCDDLLYSPKEDKSFDDLKRVLTSPLYEKLYDSKEETDSALPLFRNSIVNDTRTDIEANALHNKYVLPRKSCYFMSDLAKIHNIIPESDHGFNLILIDPPWENGSARQKLRYPTLPNRYFLSLPIKQLVHTEGALVALWITNREKLRFFVENELFPSWGVKHIATHYWLKVKPDCSLIGDLDLFHHRPYECLLLGFHQREGSESNCLSRVKQIPDNQIIISIPGDYSRKPPIGELLLDYIPGSQPVRSIELFAREMIAGWTSWGNEPLHFQESSYFSRKATK